MTDKTRVLKALLQTGYFPKELPYPFTTETFGENAEIIIEQWQEQTIFKIDKKTGKIDKKPKSGSYTYELGDTEPELISKPKRNYERRQLHVTHIIPQALLAREIAENYKTIQKWLMRNKFSIDQIRMSPTHARGVKGINFQTHEIKKNFITAISDWIIKTDINRFYPSIYTHSITWAAYGKENVKSNIALYKGSLADRLDLLVRKCNRNQTVGIPIGPETSRIIAEIISARIDDEIASLSADLSPKNTDRLQDDWTIGLNSLEKAESVFSKISAAYREFGLEINGTKTSIDHILASNRTSWVYELNAFLSHRAGKIRGQSLNALFALALRLQSENSSAPVVSYVLSVLESRGIDMEDVPGAESFLLEAAAVSPASMEQIARIMININYNFGPVSARRVTERFTSLAALHLENGNVYEAVWLIYAIRGLNKNLASKRIAEIAEKMNSSVLALILLDMRNRGQCISKLPQQTWEKGIDAESIRSGWNWLLAYEGIRHGWLADKKNLSSDAIFQPLLERGVYFYDEKRNVPRSKNVSRAKKNERWKEAKEAKRLLQLIRGLKHQISFLDYVSEYLKF